MKRIIVFWLVLLLPILVFSQEYESDEIKIKFNVNDDFIVLSRDNLDEAVLESLNTTKEKMESIMNSNNIYYIITKSDLSYEVVIVVPKTKPSFRNLSEATDKELSNIKNIIIKETGDNKPTVYKNKYAYIVVNYQDINGYVINYYTVVDSKGYNIQMQKKTEITDEEEDELEEIIDSIKYLTNENKKEENKTRKFDYKIIIFSVLIGLAAGVITYFISTTITKKKQMKN